MTTRKNRIAITVVVLCAFAALISGLFVAHQLHLPKHIDISRFHGTFLEQPRAIQTFALTGIDEQAFTTENLKNHWTLMFFGFTSCGYLCPTTMAELGKMYRLLEENHIEPLPQVMMVSIDPERDDLSKLSQYVKTFGAHFYGAKGAKETIDAMTQEMGIAYAKIALKGGEGNQSYDMEHTGTIMLFNPKGELQAFFTTPHHAESLVEDYQLLLAANA